MISGVYLQKVHSYLKEDGSQKKLWQCMWIVKDAKARGCKLMKIKDKNSFLKDK